MQQIRCGDNSAMSIDFKKIAKAFSYFICYSFAGWVYEMLLWLLENHELVNRGFLFGPWLPIYGFGGITIYALMYGYAKEPRIIKIFGHEFNVKPLMVFALVALSATAVELASTYVLDFLGIDWTQLWKYDKYVLNFEYRISLMASMMFGLLGAFIIYRVQPRIAAVAQADGKIAMVLKTIIICLFLIDAITHLIVGSNYTGVPFLVL